MVTISGEKFYEEPTSCGTCPFLSIPGKNGPSFMQTSDRGPYHCRQWDEWHHSWKNVPRRCQKLFKAALTYPDGSELVVVGK